MTDKEILEKRLDLFADESWGIFTKELTSMAQSLENIQTIEDEKTPIEKIQEIRLDEESTK